MYLTLPSSSTWPSLEPTFLLRLKLPLQGTVHLSNHRHLDKRCPSHGTLSQGDAPMPQDKVPRLGWEEDTPPVAGAVLGHGPAPP